MSLPALINYFADFVQIKKLLLEKLRDLRDTMPRQSSLCFLLFYYHHVTYRTTCHTSGHLVIYRECYGFERAFFTLRFFLPCTPSCYFQGLSGAGSLTLKLPGFHADLRNIFSAQLFVSITTVQKMGYSGRSI